MARDLAEALTVEVAVVGGGPAGLTAAIALASAGIETALVARRPSPDRRTTALLSGSVTALDTLGVWAGCAAQAAPLRVLRIVDATSRLIRARKLDTYVSVKPTHLGLRTSEELCHSLYDELATHCAGLGLRLRV